MPHGVKGLGEVKETDAGELPAAACLLESRGLELCGTIAGMCCPCDGSQIVRGEEEGRIGHTSGRTLFSLV